MLCQDNLGGSCNFACPTIPGNSVFGNTATEGPYGQYNASVGSAISFLHKLWGMPDQMGTFLLPNFFKDFLILPSSRMFDCQSQELYCTGCYEPPQSIGFSLYMNQAILNWLGKG